MTRKHSLIALSVLSAALMSACSESEQSSSQQQSSAPSSSQPAPVTSTTETAPAAATEMNDIASEAMTPALTTLSGTIVEAQNAGGYTYVQIDTGTEKVWAAGPETQLTVGDNIDLPEGSPMHNFTSKTLEQTFDVIYFVPQLGGAPASGMPSGHPSMDGDMNMMQDVPPGHPPMGGDNSGVEGSAPMMQQEEIPAPDFSGIVKPDGGQRVEDIYLQKDTLAGQVVKIRGKAVKFSPEIMGTNWLHIQDGSGAEGTSDLVVTTSDTVNVGDTVLVEGTLTLNKDFGYGYQYGVIIEEAKLSVE